MPYIRPEKNTTRNKSTVVWPAMFFGGFKLQWPEKTTIRNKKKVQLSDRRLKYISDNRLSCQNTNTNYYKTGKNYDRRKKRYSCLVVGWSTKHKWKTWPARQLYLFFFRVVIFWGRNWCLYFDTSTNYGTYIRLEKNTTRKKRYRTVVWPAMFFSGSNYNRKKLQTKKKGRYSLLAAPPTGWNKSQVAVSANYRGVRWSGFTWCASSQYGFTPTVR